MDTLIFAAATVTAFIVESYKLLKPHSGDVTATFLGQCLAVQVATASTNRSTFQLPDLTTRRFSPSHSAVAVNILWFLNFVCSLAAALCATLLQQWVWGYLQRIQRHTRSPRHARVWAFSFAGSEKRRMDQVVESIPPLLHMLLYFFLAGLFVFLSSLNKAVTRAVAAIVAYFMCFYSLATFAPLLDPSPPFEMPLLFILWHLKLVLPGKLPHWFKDTGIHHGHGGSGEQGAARQDAKALQWVYEIITDARELEPFGVLELGGWVQDLEGCIEAARILAMVDWNNTFAAKVICVSVMSSHPFLLSHFQYLDLPQNIHELSQQVDEAVREIDDLRWRLEETLQPPSGFDNKTVLDQLLRKYMDSSNWQESGSPHGKTFLQIYAHQILACMRVTISPPLLDVTVLPASPERSNTRFPFFVPAAFTREEYKNLRGELKPLSSALNALGFEPTAGQTMDNIMQV
ncbi:hypothetical protein DXG01_017240 [Tephrocybe rancida]|nr:hypothetical protein DXG01_017240 [Tephrocybe rancida]